MATLAPSTTRDPKGRKFISVVGDAYDKAGLSEEEAQRVNDTPGLGELVGNFIAENRHSNRLSQTFSVVVDYSKTLAEMIVAGNYDWINSDITADHFPLKGEGQQPVKVILFHFNRFVSSEQAIKEMDKAGFRPANPAELLALGAAQGELQRQFPIVALGLFWQHPDGHRYVVVLRRYDAERRLDLYWFEGDWDAGYRFAAVSK